MLEQRRGMIPASASVPIMVYVFPDPGQNVDIRFFLISTTSAPKINNNTTNIMKALLLLVQPKNTIITQYFLLRIPPPHPFCMIIFLWKKRFGRNKTKKFLIWGPNKGIKKRNRKCVLNNLYDINTQKQSNQFVHKQICKHCTRQRHRWSHQVQHSRKQQVAMHSAGRFRPRSRNFDQK